MIKTLALVIKKFNLGETDRILTIITPVMGKKRVSVSGIRKPTSKLAGHLDTLTVSHLILTEKPELPKVTSALAVESFQEIRCDLTKLFRANLVIKLSEKIFLEDTAQQTLFQLTLDSLIRIEREQSWSATWLCYLWGVTRYLGIAPEIRNCNRCHNSIEEGGYWSESEQQLYCRDCCQNQNYIFLDRNAVKTFSLLSKKDYLFIRKVAIPEDTLLVAEKVLVKEIAKNINQNWSEYASLGRNR